jgi:NAD-dependent deacetylase
LTQAQPNATHHVVAALERAGYVRAVVTQNIDGLHTKAGSARVLEVHGTFRRAHCMRCRSEADLEEIDACVARSERPTCLCGGLLKPDVVLFGDPLPPAFEEATREVDAADLLLVLGSSLEVYPVADLVPRAKRRGVRVAIVNRDLGPFDDEVDLVVHSALGPTMQALGEALRLDI